MTNKIKQQDKIKVWKCEVCTAPEPCRKISGTSKYFCLSQEKQKWTICDKYQITECKPEQAGTPISLKQILGVHAANLEIIAASIKAHGVQPYQKQVIDDLSPTQIDASVMGINIHEPHHQGNEGHTTAPPADTPPHKRVKIIWSEVTKDNVHIAAAISNIDPDRIYEYEKEIIGELNGAPLLVCDIPKSWLEDIPAEPTGPIETAALVKKFLDDAGYGHPHDIQAFRFGDHMRDIFFTLLEVAVLAEANNELRHTESISFKDWSENRMMPDTDKGSAREGWNAHAHACGYP